MADDLDSATDSPDILDIAQALNDIRTNPEALSNQMKAVEISAEEIVKFVVFAVIVFVSKAIGPIAAGIGKGINASEESLSELAASTLSGMFGISLSSGELAGAGAGGSAGQRVADAVLRGMGTAAAPLQPSDVNAKNFVALSMNVALKGWLQGFLFEILGEAGTLGTVKPEEFARITEVLEDALGLGRLTRRVLQPYLTAVAITPFQWQVNKTYSPALLSPALAAQQYYRARWTKDQAIEELARQGWSADRIEAHFNAAAKHLAATDIVWMVRKGVTDTKTATDLLADLGYDAIAAAQLLNVENAKATHAIVDKHADLVATRWVDGFVDDAELQSWLSQSEQDDALRAVLVETLQSEQKIPVKRISKADIEQCVLRNILSIVDYRQWLSDERYDPKSAIAMELLLQETIQDKQAAAAAKLAAQKARDAAAAQKAVDDAKKKAALELQQDTKQPSLSDIRQAFVRGLVPIDRYATALAAAKYAPADIAFLVEAAQQDRDAQAALQAKRDAAAATPAATVLSLGTLDQLVLAGVFSLEEYGRRLAGAGFSSDDAAALVALMTTKLAQQSDAKARQAAADQALAAKGLSRADEERAVRKGVQTLAQYAAWLQAQGFSEGDAAILAATLQTDLATAAAAQRLADQVNATPAAKTLSLAQLETAVVAGVRPIDDYVAALKQLKYSGDDIDTLATLLQQKIDDAAAARAKHDQVAQATATKPLSISQVERGVILGSIDMAGYQDYLARAGYGPDDVALLVANLTVELQLARAQQATRDAAAAKLAAAGVNLADLEAQILAGAGDIETYRGALLARQIPPADVDVLLTVLQRQLDAQQDAVDLEATVAGALKAKSLSLPQWQAAVKDGTRTLADFGAFLEGQGYSLADAQVLITAAAEAIPAAPTSPAP
jgi:hypothetical protein